MSNKKAKRRKLKALKLQGSSRVPSELLKLNEEKNMTYTTKELKAAAIVAQQAVVDAAVGQPAVSDAKALLAEIKSATVTS